MRSPDQVLVTGGNGRLGRALSSAGAKTLARDALDITERDSIRAALDHYQPSLVINAAAYTNVEEAETDIEAAFEINGAGAGNVATVCAEAGVPLIHISTDYIFGDGSPDAPLKEEANPDPLSVYGESKLAGERAVSGAGDNATIVRVSWLYDGGPDTFIDKMLKFGSQRDEMMVVDDATGRPTAVCDLAPILLKLGTRILSGDEIPHLLHIGPPEPVSRCDWASEIFEESKKLGGPFPSLSRCTSDAFPTKVRHPLGLVLDTSLADGLLGPMPSWRQTTVDAVRGRLNQQAGA